MTVKHIHYTCGACGTTKATACFGITSDGYNAAAPLPESKVAVRIHAHGARHVQWEHHPLNLEDARALQARYKAVLAKLEAEIAEAENG